MINISNSTAKWLKKLAALVIIAGVYALLVHLYYHFGLNRPESDSPVTIIAVNDIYRIAGSDRGAAGGMARVRELRKFYEAKGHQVLMLHGGDLLSPSLLGRTYQGEQMIALMNLLDGNTRPNSFDDRLIAVFGNHEFDDTHCSREGPLPGLVEQSEFTWLAGNLNFAGCEPLKPLANARNIARSKMIEIGGLRIGLYGLTIAEEKYRAIVRGVRPIGDLTPEQLDLRALQLASCDFTRRLRGRGADLVLALTHLDVDDDRALLGITPDDKPMNPVDRPCADEPDYVIGGHDHIKMAVPAASPRIFKADADAVTANVFTVEKTSDGPLLSHKLVELNAAYPVDPLVQQTTGQWLARHDERFCATDCLGRAEKERKQCLKTMVSGGTCLKVSITRARSIVETDEMRNRSQETGFGNWIADEMRSASQADVAFVNSGALRLNEEIDAGKMILRRHIEEMFQHDNKLVIRELPASQLYQAVAHAVTKRGGGAWAHFSGIAVKLKDARTIEALYVKPFGAQQAFRVEPDSDRLIRVVSSAYVMAGRDDHGFWPADCVQFAKKSECDDHLVTNSGWLSTWGAGSLKSFVVERLTSADEARGGLTLVKDGRLCEPGAKNCLINQWTKEP